MFDKILPYLLSGISVGGQYALIAVGYTMVYGILRLINFAHGDIFTAAGFFMVYIATALPVQVAIPLVVALTVALGFSPESRDLKPFVGDHFQVVEKFMQCPLAESMLIPLNGTIRNEIAEEVLRYIEFHTESTLNINSLRVLRELFS